MRTKTLLIVATFFLALAAACQAAVPAAGKPTIVLLTPPQGSTYVAGEDVVVQSSASDAAGVVRIDLYVDNNLVAQDAPPVAQGQTQFQVIQKWKAGSPGPHTLTVRAYSASGSTADAGVVVNVNASGAANVTTPGATTLAVASPVIPTPAVAVPTLPATQPPAPGPTTCAPNAAFVRDVTIPDNTVLSPNQAFTKTWLVSNNGNCPWGTGFVLTFAGGTAMSLQNAVPLPAVAPGGTTELSVPMQAPAQPGTYTSNWRMRDANGKAFGSGLTAVIVVPAPTNAPATNLPPPTAPVVDLPSFDGGQDISINTDGSGIRIQARFTLNEPTKIDHVDFVIMDGNGKVIDTHRENTAPYCYLGEANDGSCALWDFAQHGNKWRSGVPAREGLIFARAVAYTKNGKIRAAEDRYWLDPSGNDNPPPNIFIDVTQTGPDNTDTVLSDALTFQVDVGNSSNFNIDRVDMYILKYDGAVIYKKTEQNEPYCAFSDQNGQCNTYNFAQNNNQWPNGARILPTMVILRAILYAGNQPVGGISQPVEIR